MIRFSSPQDKRCGIGSVSGPHLIPSPSREDTRVPSPELGPLSLRERVGVRGIGQFAPPSRLRGRVIA